MRLRIDPKPVVGSLVACVVLLTLAGAASLVLRRGLGFDFALGFVPLFDLGSDQNVPTWWSSFVLLLCSALLGVITLAKKQSNDRYWTYWAGLAVIFLLLSLDETASIHERVGHVLSAKWGPGGVFH